MEKTVEISVFTDLQERVDWLIKTDYYKNSDGWESGIFIDVVVRSAVMGLLLPRTEMPDQLNANIRLENAADIIVIFRPNDQRY
jgi:hypothetical protein